MPEGAEVLRCGDQLSKLVKDKTLIQLKPLSGKLSRQIQPIDFNLIIESVKVKGKSIFIQLEDGREIFSSLGMSGWWYPDSTHNIDTGEKAYVRGKLVSISDILTSARKHARVELILDSKPNVLYVDPRNFGNLKILSSLEAKKIRQNLGVEILLPGKVIDGEAAISALRNQGKREIGEVLLDQRVLCGLGNIYRAETLYLARINPFRMISSLSLDDLSRITMIAATVLSIAYHFEGSMCYDVEFLSKYLGDLKIDPSYDRIQGRMVYGRSQDIFGNDVIRSRSAGRTIWWVPNIQT